MLVYFRLLSYVINVYACVYGIFRWFLFFVDYREKLLH